MTTPLSVSVIACGPDNNVKPSYLTDLGFKTNEAYSLSSTTTILSSGTNQKAWFFDSSKPVGSQLTDLNHFINTFYRLSDKTGIFLLDTMICSNRNAWFFDVTSGQPVFTDLGIKVGAGGIRGVYRLSDTKAIIQNGQSNDVYYFDAPTINLGTALSKKITNFYRISETTGIFIDDTTGSASNSFFFDGTNAVTNPFTDLNKRITSVTRLSDTKAIVSDATSSYLFDTVGNNFTDLKQDIRLFTTMS
ncbi:hypothetical protein [Spiroplasma endosymbiont of Virgichneumon dumeticola]|uniref:hypothetical protein n=1 Tax=Spiroplasma endosymbiont of Virgichneumon dumeticola TaxID=3139323 RepID=UPI0035C8A798